MVALALLVLSSWAASKVVSDFDIEWFIPSDSYYNDVYEVRDTYFAGRQTPFSMYTRQIDYPNLQTDMTLLSSNLISNEYVSSCSNWHTTFSAYLVAEEGIPSGIAPR